MIFDFRRNIYFTSKSIKQRLLPLNFSLFSSGHDAFAYATLVFCVGLSETAMANAARGSNHKS